MITKQEDFIRNLIREELDKLNISKEINSIANNIATKLGYFSEFAYDYQFAYDDKIINILKILSKN